MGELSLRCWATLGEGAFRNVLRDGGSSCRMELTGLDLPERGTLGGERCPGTGGGWGVGAVGYFMVLLLCPLPFVSPKSTIKLHRRSAGSSAGGGGMLAIGGAGHGSQVCLVWPAQCFKRSWSQPFT